jgi:hypothetical protein
MYQMLYQSLNQRWSANRGCVLMSVFSSKPSMQMRCYRVEYGSCGGNKKAACNCPLVKVFRKHTTTGAYERQRACANGLNIVTLHSNNLIVHNFLMCQQVFLYFLIVCYASSKVRVAFKQPFGLSSHDFVL